MPNPEPVAELRGVTKIYREGERRRAVLRDVDLTVAPGELLILLGRSGSGKSTVLNLLAGIDAPTRGEVLLGGEPLSRMQERERTLLRRDKIGFIFQFFNLIPTLTVEENLLLPLELSGRLDPAERRRALELLDSVGLADRHASFPDVLSGGTSSWWATATDSEPATETQTFQTSSDFSTADSAVLHSVEALRPGSGDTRGGF